MGLADAPAWLLDLLLASDHRDGRAPDGDGEVIPEGERNSTLASLAGTMRRRGMTEAEILAALRVVNAERCDPRLNEAEVEQIAASIARYEPAASVIGDEPDSIRDSSLPVPPAVTDRIGWTPKPLSALAAVEDAARWSWRGYLAPGEVTLLTALWKSGKTTLVSYLLRASCRSESAFAGQALRPMRVLVVTEESEAKWAERRDDLQLTDAVHAISRPFKGRADPRAWQALVGHVAGLVEAGGYDLVIFDSLPNLWWVRDENDAAQVLAALAPLHAITAAGAAVLLVAHPSKGDRGEGRATRGSGAIGGWVDIIVEMRRYDPERREDTRRVLTSYSRWDATPPEVVLDWQEGVGYELLGGKADAKAADRWAVLAEILPAEGAGLTPQETREAWPEDGPPSERTIRRDLDAAVEQRRVVRTGCGGRGNAYRYRRVAGLVTGASGHGCHGSAGEGRPTNEKAPDSIRDSSGAKGVGVCHESAGAPAPTPVDELLALAERRGWASLKHPRCYVPDGEDAWRKLAAFPPPFLKELVEVMRDADFKRVFGR